MNRALLVVICDFMVLSMMSMSQFAPNSNPHGLAGGGIYSSAVFDAALSQKILEEMKMRYSELEKQYAEASREALSGEEAAKLRLDSMAAELASAKVQIEYLTQRLALTPEEIGELSPEALRKLWEDEAKNRELAQVRYETISNEVQFLRATEQAQSAELRQVSQTLAVEKEKNFAANTRIEALTAETERQKAAIETNTRIIAAQNASLEEKNTSLREKELALNTERRRYEELATDMGTVRSEALRMSEELKSVSGELTDNKARLAVSSAQLEYTMGQLKSVVNENETNRILLAEVRSQLEAEKRRAKEAAEKAMLREAELQRNIAVIERDYTQTVAELSKITSERDNAQRQRDNYKDAMDNAVDAVRETANQNKILAQQIKEAEAKTLNVVLARYRETVNTIKFNLTEKRLLMDYNEKRELYWPEIMLDGRRFIIGDIRTLTGYDRNIYSDQITNLAITFSKTDSLALPITSLAVSAADNRVALLEMAGPGVSPLRPMTADELQKRGLNDLYAFKANRNGEVFLLGDRCVLDLDSDNAVLKVRNRRRGKDAAAHAVEPGDFIISREGTFVGMAVGLTERDSSGDDAAQIFVFPAGNALEGAINVPLSKTGEIHSGFVSTMSSLQNTWKNLDSGVSR